MQVDVQVVALARRLALFKHLQRPRVGAAQVGRLEGRHVMHDFHAQAAQQRGQLLAHAHHIVRAVGSAPLLRFLVWVVLRLLVGLVGMRMVDEHALARGFRLSAQKPDHKAGLFRGRGRRRRAVRLPGGCGDGKQVLAYLVRPGGKRRHDLAAAHTGRQFPAAPPPGGLPPIGFSAACSSGSPPFAFFPVGYASPVCKYAAYRGLYPAEGPD